MTTSTVRTALFAHESLAPKEGDPFTMPQAVLFAYCADGFRVLATAGDIYEGLSSLPYEQTLNDYEQGIGVLTTGWAAPLNENGEAEGAPSQHSERQRVRLCACVERDGEMGSAVVFQNNPDNPMTDEGDAVGTLAIALHEALIKLTSN